ncbi:phage tail assembly protein [Entomobacter blattae]|uniref:Uncharacterized protein n=1 Tax=Entomobacter blattae TaxID=2762277 RepID=A0A7H1NUI3_9PROT|nr:phage tail assembly protein [Entomobacter blattae]QNT79443.1 hypothetical protein JGUZn3_22420 [Entomobacter blattae]
MENEKILVLDTPIEDKENTYQELKLREPTVYEVQEAANFVRLDDLETTILESQTDLVRRISG